MKLELLGIAVSGFKNFVKPIELDFPSPGLYFAAGRNETNRRMGSNGSGKSTILADAWAWLLYGRTIDGLKNPDVMPWAKAMPTSVTGRIKVDGRLYTVTRQTKPNLIIINDKEVRQEEIVRLINMDYPVFTHTVILGQGQPLFFDLTPSAKAQLFNDVLDLERWEDRSWKAAEETLHLNNTLAAVNGEIASAEANAEQLAGLLDAQVKAHDQWEVERAKRLFDATASLKKVLKQSEAAKQLYDDAYTAHDMTVTEFRDLEDKLVKLDRAFRTAEDAHRRALYDLDVKRTEARRLLNERADLDKAKNCPTCGQPIKVKDLAGHKLELLKQANAINKTVEAGVDAAVVATADKAKKDLETCRKHRDEFRTKVRDLEDARDAAHAHSVEVQSQVDVLQREVKSLDDDANPHRDQLQRLRKTKKEQAENLAALKKEAAEVSREAERHKFWVKGFKDVRLYVIEELLAELEFTTNAALEDMGLVGWQVNFVVESETKSGTVHRALAVNVVSPTSGKPVRWEAWSGGEKQRLRLAGALALSEVLLNHAGMSIDMEVIDEPSRGMGGEGINDLVDYLSRRARQLRRVIFLIEHHAVRSSKVSGTITIVNTKGGSHVEA